MDIGQLTLALNLGTILGVAALLFLIWAFATNSRKKDTRKTLFWIGGIAALMFILPIAGVGLNFFGTQLGGGVQTGAVVPTLPTPGGGTTKVCAVEDTTVTLSSVNKYTEVSTGGSHRYRINGNPALVVSDAGTFTASPGDTVTVLFGNETDGTYYGALATEVIGCQGTQTISAKRVQNGTMTINVYNEEGNQINGNAENETLAAGDIASLKWEVRGTNQQGYPFGGVFMLEVNKTDYDEGNLKLFLDGTELSKTTTPDVQALSSVDNTIISFLAPAIEGAALHTGTIILDVDSGANPGNTNDPVIRFRPYDYFINEDTGGSYDGPAAEDEDNAASFGHLTSTTIHVN